MTYGGSSKNQSKLIIATIVFPGDTSEVSTLLLLESIRAFAGALSNVDIWCFIPESEKDLSPKTQTRINELDVTLIPLEIDSEIGSFPFTRHAQAASLAESKSIGKADLVAWVAPNTLVLREPSKFILKDGISLGYRPVHHKLLGLKYNEPLDPFWSAIYKLCNVPADRVFAMKPQVENLAIRPYFNAGCLVVKPERTILQSWHDMFLKAYQEAVFKNLYQEDSRYAIFVHQAILSGVILSRLTKNEMEELPADYNYPLNLYFEDDTGNRPDSLEECVTIRHEGFYQDPKWTNTIPAGTGLKEWIADRLG
ncbi:MAG: hypothetical protein ACW960_08705 [Candidatus Thorarchaeota archaeon]|jgi:hypothetical protein